MFSSLDGETSHACRIDGGHPGNGAHPGAGREIVSRIESRVLSIYGAEMGSSLLPRIEELVSRYAGRIPRSRAAWDQTDALLIAYGDSLTGAGAPIRELHGFLNRNLREEISLVHLLPIYPYTSDDGFSVVDYRAVREDLGAWSDVQGLAGDYRVVLDGVVNHVSASSAYVRGYLQNEPAYRDFCISLPRDADVSSVLRTRNLPLLHEYAACDGPRWLWTTFSADQVDLNFANPEVLVEILDVLLFYAAQGASVVRLDAIPYLWKKQGTTCAHLRETHELIKLIRDVYDMAAPHVLLLTETNVPHRENVSYFGHAGDEAQIIYNFSLAPLIVWSFYKGDARRLTEWARGIEWISPRATYLNITATHDGIGMRPTEGILSESERRELVQLSHDRHGGVTGKRNADGSVTPYELNITYFDAINDPRHPRPVEAEAARFIASQAIPMAMMGIPGIYIHSLLGSRNDLEAVERTGHPRSINRSRIEVARLEMELARPDSIRRQVFEGIRRLLRIRSGESAFHPDAGQEVLDVHPAVFALRRTNAATGASVLALHNVSDGPVTVRLPGPEADAALRDLLAGEQFEASATLALGPSQVRWLKASIS